MSYMPFVDYKDAQDFLSISGNENPKLKEINIQKKHNKTLEILLIEEMNIREEITKEVSKFLMQTQENKEKEQDKVDEKMKDREKDTFNTVQQNQAYLEAKGKEQPEVSDKQIEASLGKLSTLQDQLLDNLKNQAEVLKEGGEKWVKEQFKDCSEEKQKKILDKNAKLIENYEKQNERLIRENGKLQEKIIKQEDNVEKNQLDLEKNNLKQKNTAVLLQIGQVGLVKKLGGKNIKDAVVAANDYPGLNQINDKYTLKNEQKKQISMNR